MCLAVHDRAGVCAAPPDGRREKFLPTKLLRRNHDDEENEGVLWLRYHCHGGERPRSERHPARLSKRQMELY